MTQTFPSSGKDLVTELRCHVGDLVEFDCPHDPESNGRLARVVAPASFNGPDWWELELIDEFFVIPDVDVPGAFVKTSQSFAPDSILRTADPATITSNCDDSTPHHELFYVVDMSSGTIDIIFGPAMSIDKAKLKAARYDRGEIVPTFLLDETVASARELSPTTLRKEPGPATDLAITAKAVAMRNGRGAKNTTSNDTPESEHA